MALLRFSRLKGVVPLVVIQIVIGVALGPSLFGRLAPEYYQLFFNQAALAPLVGIGSVAVLVFGLITGLHLDPETFRRNGRATSIVAAASVAVPAALGCVVGYWILARHPEERAPGIRPVEFAAAVGICTGARCRCSVRCCAKWICLAGASGTWRSALPASMMRCCGYFLVFC